MNYETQNIPEYINVSTMAKMLCISRSRLYQLIEQGVLLKPIHVEESKRPLYSREMIIKNLEVKRNNAGINGTIVMFYTQRSKPNIKPVAKLQKKSPQKQPVQNEYKSLIDDLESLGQQDVSAAEFESALSQCYPNGTAEISEDETLTTIFRHLKRQNTEHKPRT